MKIQLTGAEALDRYFELMEQAPALFESPAPALKIVTDRAVIENWMQDSDFVIGVVYETPWNIHCVDLVENPGGVRFPYERVLPVDLGKHHGTVILPKLGDDYILIRIFRHALRTYVWEFPRGFNDGIDGIANAVKELKEEIGAEVRPENVRLIGTVSPNTAFEAIYVDIFEAEIDAYHAPQEEEGITRIMQVSREELVRMIRAGEIVDSFTLTAYLLSSQQKGEKIEQ